MADQPAEEFSRRVLEAMEAAGVSGLCLEGRIEIGIQEARRLRPELDDATLQPLVKGILADAGDMEA
ncbi:MAG: hypothetical protein P8080_09695 [Gammaproteobacteria bacterium]